MSSVRKISYMFVLFSVYMMVFGAVMFAVEKTGDDQQVNKHVILQDLWMSIQQKYNMTREEFDNITRVIHQAQVMDGEPWTYSRAVRFAMVSCTTIGYGSITPKTKGGMMLCIIGALFGIPLTLLTLNSIGAMVTDGCTKIIQTIEKRLLKRNSAQSVEMKRLLLITILMTLMIMIGAGILMQVTDWSFIESVYFWFITFSTIGFGDYVPHDSVIDDNTPHITAAIVVVNMIFTLTGLAVLASVINCALEIPRDWIRCVHCLRRRSSPRVENTDKVLQPIEKVENPIT